VAAPPGSDDEFLGGSSMSWRGSKGGRRRRGWAIYNQLQLAGGTRVARDRQDRTARVTAVGRGSPQEEGGADRWAGEVSGRESLTGGVQVSVGEEREGDTLSGLSRDRRGPDSRLGQMLSR
jgi:hypothetical protein